MPGRRRPVAAPRVARMRRVRAPALFDDVDPYDMDFDDMGMDDMGDLDDMDDLGDMGLFPASEQASIDALDSLLDAGGDYIDDFGDDAFLTAGRGGRMFRSDFSDLPKWRILLRDRLWRGAWKAVLGAFPLPEPFLPGEGFGGGLEELLGLPPPRRRAPLQASAASASAAASSSSSTGAAASSSSAGAAARSNRPSSASGVAELPDKEASKQPARQIITGATPTALEAGTKRKSAELTHALPDELGRVPVAGQTARGVAVLDGNRPSETASDSAGLAQAGCESQSGAVPQPAADEACGGAEVRTADAAHAEEPRGDTSIAAVAKRTRMPRFAFELFQEDRGKGKSTWKVVHEWKHLPSDEREAYMQQAKDGLDRCKAEAEADPWFEAKLSRKKRALEQKLARFDKLPPSEANEAQENAKKVAKDPKAKVVKERKVRLPKEPRTRKKPGVAQSGASASAQGEGEDASLSLTQTSTRRKRKSKATKLPDYPEKPLSAYAIFCKERAPAFRADQPAAAGAGVEASPEGAETEDCLVAAAPKTDKPSRGSNMLKNLRLAWNSLSLEDRGKYEEMAAKERTRFNEELEKWRTEHPDCTVPSEDDEGKLGKRRRKNASKTEQLPGYPEKPRTAYAYFCTDRAPALREAATQVRALEPAAAAPGEGSAVPLEGAETSADTPTPTAKRRNVGTCILQDLRNAWNALSAEERGKYEVMAAEDTRRFQEEFERWRAQQPNDGLGQAAAVRAEKKPQRLSVSRPRIPKASDICLVPGDKSMNGIINSVLRDEKTRTAQRRAEQKRSGDLGVGVAPAGSSTGLPPRASDSAAAPHSQRPNRSSYGTLHGTGCDGALPVPQRAPTSLGPSMADSDVMDDVLGGLLADDGSADEPDTGLGLDDNGEDVGGALAPFDEEADLGAPTSIFDDVAPSGAVQVCIDASGNIVADQSSLRQNVQEEEPELETAEHEAVSEYVNAYRKTPQCKWSEDETERFYEALSIYGTDLFLVQTCFTNKSAAQIKTKFQKEMKKHADKVEEYLTTKAQKLTKDKFEAVYGTIDTSKHFKPPASPKEGEEPAAEEPPPGEEKGEDPADEEAPPTPEFSAEDESHTTNRLMALFD